jgi:hypothetical protein
MSSPANIEEFSVIDEKTIQEMEKMRMTIIPILGDEWFVFVGPEDRKGWESPKAVLEFLEGGNFAGCGAASGKDLAALINEASKKAIEKRATEKQLQQLEETDLPDNVRPLH